MLFRAKCVLFSFFIGSFLLAIKPISHATPSMVILETEEDTLPEFFPEIAIDITGNTGDGIVLFSPIVNSLYHLIAIDNSGAVVHYVEDDIPGVRYIDFKQWTENTFSFYRRVPSLNNPAFYIMDSNFAIIDSFRAEVGREVDLHDIKLLPNGHALLLTYDTQIIDLSTMVDGGEVDAAVTVAMIQEVDNERNVYWEWSSWDVYDLEDYILEPGDALLDFTTSSISFTYANSLAVDDEGNILISIRNMNEIIKINGTTGETIWRLGGKHNEFTFVNDDFNGFNVQHDAQWVGPNNITVFDNGSYHEPPTTRVVEYELDEINKTATLVWEFRNPYGAVSGSAGNAQRLPNGNTLIGWGGKNLAEAPACTEVTLDGDIVYELRFLEDGMPVGQSSYRFHRVPLAEEDTLPDFFPKIAIDTIGNTGDGIVLFSPIVNSLYHLIAIDNNGSVVHYIEDDTPGVRYADFKQLPDGKFSYFRQVPGENNPAYYVMDSSFAVVDSFRAGNGAITDIHDIEFLPNGHALVMVYDQQTVDMSVVVDGGHPAALVAGLLIQEVDNQMNVYWEWSSWDHFEITDGISAFSGALLDFTAPSINYNHANSLDLDEDGNILLSSRNMHEVTKIDRVTGEIIWRLGGKNNEFTFVNDSLNGFTDQHDARWVAPNRLTIFDNGDYHEPPTTRAVEYEIDEVNKTATLVWQFQNPYGAVSGAMGNAQRLPNGNTLIGWGGRSPFETPACTEVTPDGEIVYELSFSEDGVFDNQFSYRFYRFQLVADSMPTNTPNAIMNLQFKTTAYPNPAIENISFFINAPKDSQGTIRLVNAQSSVVLEKNVFFRMGKNHTSIATNTLASGLYIYEIVLDNGHFSRGKIIVQSKNP